jgi:hypothetical protein
MSNSETLNSQIVVKNPATSVSDYYCTEDDWREFTGFTNQNDFPSSEVLRHLKNATEQVKKDGFYMVRWELVSKDSEGRYFTQRKYWGNRYDRDNKDMELIAGEVQKYDLEVYEADTTSSIASSLMLQGTRINRLMYRIPYDAITDFNPLNCWFKLSSDYPTSNRQIFVTYWVVGKPLDELQYELKRACIEMTTILALQKLKTKRLKKATVSYTLGKQTITRDENTFDEMIKQHKKEYENWIKWFKPFIGRRVRIGRMETEDKRQFLNRY